MPKIEFVKVERDCQYNREIPAKSKKRRIIDYDVLIDGEKRAQWSALSFNSGWRLRDTLGEIISQPPKSSSHSRRDINASQIAEFASLVEQHLSLIPSADEIEQIKNAKAEADERQMQRRREQVALETMQDAASDLYAALLAARARIDNERAIIFRSEAVPNEEYPLSMDHAEDMARGEVQELDALLEIIDAALNKAVPHGRS